MLFAPSSKGRLTEYDLGRFPEDTLFHRLARAVCRSECLPRKELFEAWETARRVRRLFRGGRIVDIGGGHGLLAHVMLLLDNSSRKRSSWTRRCRRRVHECIGRSSPRGRGYLIASSSCRAVSRTWLSMPMTWWSPPMHAEVSATSSSIARQLRAARVAVLPCCHDLDVNDDGDLSGWVEGPLAVDVVRALRLKQQGYRIWTQSISAEITPKNRLLIGAPREPSVE
jgi:hypothetical protein